MKDPYAVLGIGRDATDEDIQKAYRSLARKWHPDMHLDEEAKKAAQEKFKEISAAYEMIGDKENRSRFDRYGEPSRPGPGATNPFSGHWKPFGSFMDDFFGRMNRTQSRGKHITVEQEVTFDQILNGGEIQVPYHFHELCPKCGGMGGELVTCVDCQGRGDRVIYGPQMTVRTPCPRCGGRGQILGSSCQDCQEGLIGPKEGSVTFTIPKGVEDGMRFLYSGKGEPIPNGQPGNLYVVVRVKPHEVFERMSNGRLLLRCPATYTQLVLGCEIEVPTLEGTVVVKVPAGTQDRSKFRLRGLGLPVFQNHGGIYNRGDQIVELNLEIPTDLTQNYRKLIEALAELERSERTQEGDDGRSVEE